MIFCIKFPIKPQWCWLGERSPKEEPLSTCVQPSWRPSAITWNPHSKQCEYCHDGGKGGGQMIIVYFGKRQLTANSLQYWCVWCKTGPKWPSYCKEKHFIFLNTLIICTKMMPISLNSSSIHGDWTNSIWHNVCPTYYIMLRYVCNASSVRQVLLGT